MYCTQAELETRYGTALLVQLSDRDETPSGAIDAALIARAIADADALIDGYLAPRYALPLAATPQLVKDLSLRISIYYAHAGVAGDKIAKDYDQALKQLKDIGAGTIRLDVAGIEPAASGGAEILTNQDERPFTPQTMKGFI